MNNYAIIASDGRIVNMIMWDGISEFAVPNGFTIELANETHLQKWREQAEALEIILQSMSSE